MSWSPLRTPYDFVILGGKISPGLAELQGFKRVFRWDERRGYGLVGAHTVYKGMGLVQGRLLLKLYTERDWEDWEDWRAILKPPEPRQGRTAFASPYGPRPHALEIVHPMMAQFAPPVRAVTVTEVSQPEQTDDGEWTITIGLIEYRRPQFHLATPDGAEDRPTDPVDQTIADLSEIIENDGRGSVAQALSHLGDL